MNELTETEKAYLAGFIDGEGCIFAGEYMRPKSATPSCRLHLTIIQSDGPFLEKWCAKTGLGNVYLHANVGKPVGGGSQYSSTMTAYQWQMYNGEAESLLRAILPYLDMKKEQADVALAIRATMKRGGYATPAGVLALRVQYMQQLKALKRKEQVDLDGPAVELLQMLDSQLALWDE